MNAVNSEENLQKGLAALRRGDAHEALSWLERAASDCPSARVWSALGAAYWQTDARPLAITAFARSVELDPADASSRFNHALALSEQGFHSEALDELRHTLRIEPTHPPARQLLNRLQAGMEVGALHSHNNKTADPLSASVLDEDEDLPPAPWEAHRQVTPSFIPPFSPPTGEHSAREASPRPYYNSLPDFDRFPWVTLLIIAVNLAVFWLMERAGGSTDREIMIEYGTQFRPLVLKGELWRLVTAMFTHAGTSHILGNMLFFAFSARWVEPFYGRARFLLLYLGAGLVGNLMTLLLTNTPTAGASGAVLGVIAARIVMGFKHGVVIPDHLQRKFGWWPLIFGAWIIYQGFHNPQTNNIAHVAGFCTGLMLAAMFAPLHELHESTLSGGVRFASWAMAGLCAYTVLGMGWSVYSGLDESADIAYAREKLAKGRLALRLVRYRDPELKYELRVPKGWERVDHKEEVERSHYWFSPMGEANVSIATYPVPQGRGGELAFALEQTLINAKAQTGALRTLSKQKRLLSGRIGGRIVMEGIDDRGKSRQLYYYFVPVKETLYILVGAVERYHVPKYAPVFDTIAASFKA